MTPTRRLRAAGAAEAGMALLAVLVILIAVGGSSTSFIWYMNQQQTRVGHRLRSAAALGMADAGLQRALSILEGVAPDGSSGRDWRPADYTETLSIGALEGRFTISLSDDPEGAVVVDSVGEVAGVTRRVRARITLAPPALLAALFGTGIVRLDGAPARTVIVPADPGIDRYPWIHIAAGGGVWFAGTDVAVNRATSPLEPGTGPMTVLLPRGVDLTLDRDRQRVDAGQLRALGVPIGEPVRRDAGFFEAPEVDQTFYQARAAASIENAGINEAAGRYHGDGNLMHKRDSVYSLAEFEQLLVYLASVSHWPATRGPALRGIVYVTGGLWLRRGQALRIADGALVAEGLVVLGPGTRLEVTHSTATRTLPGLIMPDGGRLTLGRNARLRAHGLVYLGQVTIGEGARLDVEGSVLTRAPEQSFHNAAGTALIRYDPAVLGTPGLRVPREAPVVTWVARWEEIP